MERTDWRCWPRGSFQLVMTDLRMPVLDGWGVVEGVRRIAPGLPVVMLSGSNEDEDRARAWGVPLVLKPAGLSELKAAVRASLAPIRGAGSSDPWPQGGERHADRGGPGRYPRPSRWPTSRPSSLCET